MADLDRLAPDATAAPAPAPPARSWWREELRFFVEVLVLTSLAVSQPVFDVTGRSGDFFVFHRVTPGEIRLFLVLVALLPPVALWAAGFATRPAGVPARRLAHLVTIALLLTVLVYQVGKQLPLPGGAPLGVVGALAGIGLAVALARSPGMRRWLTYAVPAPLVFVLLFVFTSPAGSLVRGGEAALRDVALARRPPIVMVFMDEFPLRLLLNERGSIDRRLFPNFARLADRTTTYTNATGIAGWTPYALPSMLTGKVPGAAVAPSYQLYPDNLFTLLAKQYRIHAFETIAQLCPPEVCENAPPPEQGETGLGPVLRQTVSLARELMSPYRSDKVAEEQFGDVLGEDHGQDEPPASPAPAKPGTPSPSASPLSTTFRFDTLRDNQTVRFDDFLSKLAAPDPNAPSLYFLHLLLPHQPFNYLPSGRRYWSSPALGEGNTGGPRGDQPADAMLAKQRILLQLAYTDVLLGKFIERLDRLGLWDPSLLVVTADHGVGMVPSDYARRLGTKNVADLAWVPLFIKRPGQKSGAVDDRNHIHVDLVPTIADVLGARIPWKVDGISAFGPPRTTTDKFFYDRPRQPQKIDGAKWRPLARKGVAPEIAKPQDGPEGLFKLGPRGDLVGRQVASFPRGAHSGLTVKVGRETRPVVDPASGTVPAMTWGWLDGSGPHRTVVVAVNGVVGAVVDTFKGRSGPRVFGALTPDRLFRGGQNTIDYYVLETSGGTLQLRPMATRS